MRRIVSPLAFLLAALLGPSLLGAEDEPKARRPSAPVIRGGVTPRVIADEEASDAKPGVVADGEKPEAKQEASCSFVVVCKVNQPGYADPLVVTAVPAGKETEIPVRFRPQVVNDLENLIPDEKPATADAAAHGHKIRVKVDEAKGNRVHLEATVEYGDAERTGTGKSRVAELHGRYDGEVAMGKMASVVLATNEEGEPKHWVEFSVRYADEQAEQEAQEATRTFSVVYSVAGLVRVAGKSKPGKKPELDFDPLIKQIEKKVAPESWAAAGGEGKILPFARNASIVVVQTGEVHGQLVAFLKRLREDEEAIQDALEGQ